MIPFPYKQKLTTCLATTVSCECKYLSLQNTNKKNMKTSLKAGFAQIFFAAQKNLSCPKFGWAAAPLAPPPARTPMLKSEPGSVSMGIHLRKLWSFKGRYSHLTWVDKFHLTFPLKIPALFLFSPSRSFRFFSTRTPGGEYFKNFWVGMCRWDPGTLNLYQNQFS